MKILIIESDEMVVALNSAMEEFALAVNFELQGAGPPAEIELVPAGPVITGRDGRSWKHPGFAVINAFFKQRGLKIPIDIEHATELKAPKGEEAPAMAWVENLTEKADGSIWGSPVTWNPRGSSMITNREYSYYSPAYYVDKATGTIVGIKSVGLTNNPNLRIPALNQERTKHGGNTMELEQLLAALGLPAGTSFAAALNHIAKVKTDLTVALNKADNPPLDRFVPKADYDLVVNRANEAEGKLKEQATTALNTAIDTEVEAALKAGKITPATKGYHIEQCRQEGGLDRFREFVKAAPVVADDSDLDGKRRGISLNAEELKVLELTGISQEDYKKANNIN